MGVGEKWGGVPPAQTPGEGGCPLPRPPMISEFFFQISSHAHIHDALVYHQCSTEIICEKFLGKMEIFVSSLLPAWSAFVFSLALSPGLQIL